jgi:hypothetical protein
VPPSILARFVSLSISLSLSAYQFLSKVPLLTPNGIKPSRVDGGDAYETVLLHKIFGNSHQFVVAMGVFKPPLHKHWLLDDVNTTIADKQRALAVRLRTALLGSRRDDSCADKKQPQFRTIAPGPVSARKKEQLQLQLQQQQQQQQQPTNRRAMCTIETASQPVRSDWSSAQLSTNQLGCRCELCLELALVNRELEQSAVHTCIPSEPVRRLVLGYLDDPLSDQPWAPGVGAFVGKKCQLQQLMAQNVEWCDPPWLHLALDSNNNNNNNNDKSNKVSPLTATTKVLETRIERAVTSLSI